MNHYDLGKLVVLLERRLSSPELKNASFSVEFPYDKVEGADLARELIHYLVRRNQLRLLLNWLKEYRPDIYSDIPKVQNRSIPSFGTIPAGEPKGEIDKTDGYYAEIPDDLIDLDLLVPDGYQCYVLPQDQNPPPLAAATDKVLVIWTAEEPIASGDTVLVRVDGIFELAQFTFGEKSGLCFFNRKAHSFSDLNVMGKVRLLVRKPGAWTSKRNKAIL